MLLCLNGCGSMKIIFFLKRKWQTNLREANANLLCFSYKETDGLLGVTLQLCLAFLSDDHILGLLVSSHESVHSQQSFTVFHRCAIDAPTEALVWRYSDYHLLLYTDSWIIAQQCNKWLPQSAGVFCLRLNSSQLRSCHHLHGLRNLLYAFHALHSCTHDLWRGRSCSERCQLLDCRHSWSQASPWLCCECSSSRPSTQGRNRRAVTDDELCNTVSYSTRRHRRADVFSNFSQPVQCNANADAINQNSNVKKKNRNTRIVKSKQEEEKQTTKNESEFISNGAQFYCSFKEQ